jgi:Tfp pilus assembly protein PilV
MSAHKQSGLALIEALMALAVMAFGLLALVGVQSNLRQNADIARQRSEAVRIAQEEIEKWRGFNSLNGTGAVVYGDLQSDAPGTGTTVSSEYGLTAQFTMTKSVFPTANTTTPAFSVKSLTVDVTWVDRNNESQRVRLSTALHGVAPELSGTLAVLAEGTPTSVPGGRNPAIPWEAVRLDDGTHSAWRPPQESDGTLVWKFSNASGLIDSICNLASGLAVNSTNLDRYGNCLATRAQLLTGYINFSESNSLATATQAMTPTGDAHTVQVWVHKTDPVDEIVAPGSGCFTGTPSHSRSFVPYYCAVPVSSQAGHAPIWSGYSYVSGWHITGNLGDLSVCRYTRYRDDRQVTGNPSIQNIEHPRAYYQVGQPLSNQNFLVVGVFYDPDPSGLNCPNGSPLPADTTTYPQPDTAP